MAAYKTKKLKNFDIYGVIVCVDKYCKYVVKTASGRILVAYVTVNLFVNMSLHRFILFFYFYFYSQLITVHVEIKIVNKEATTKRSTLLFLLRRCTFEQSDVILIRKGKRKKDN